jgi:dihydrodipicolinate synthase/N-acetylneuraminate lyase
MSLTGIIVPLVTPVAEDGGVDHDAVLDNAHRVLGAGVQGLYLCGGTGDAAQLSAADRRTIVEETLPLVREAGASAIVHVGQSTLGDARALADHAAAAGADAIASVPLRGAWAQNVRYYRELTSSGAPVFVYHMPPAGFQASFEELSEVLRLPGVAGAKVSDWNLFLLRRLLDAFPEQRFYSGLDEILGSGLLTGAHGSIGTWGNLVPRFYARVWEAVQAGRADDVLAMQTQWQRFLAVGWNVDIIGAFESLMAHRGYASACFRVPAGAPRLSDADLGDMIARLDAIEALA